MCFSPRWFRLYAIGSATATMIPFVDSPVALAYAWPRDPAPMIRIRGGFADMAGRGGAGSWPASLSMGESACGAIVADVGEVVVLLYNTTEAWGDMFI